jgi:hypothetical protein
MNTPQFFFESPAENYKQPSGGTIPTDRCLAHIRDAAHSDSKLAQPRICIEPRPHTRSQTKMRKHSTVVLLQRLPFKGSKLAQLYICIAAWPYTRPTANLLQRDCPQRMSFCDDCRSRTASWRNRAYVLHRDPTLNLIRKWLILTVVLVQRLSFVGCKLA